MYGVELMRLLGGQQMELETYKMRNGHVLVLVELKEHDRYEVTIYNRSDIEERSWIFFFKDEAKKKFDEVKKADQSPIDTETGAKK